MSAKRLMWMTYAGAMLWCAGGCVGLPFPGKTPEARLDAKGAAVGPGGSGGAGAPRPGPWTAPPPGGFGAGGGGPGYPGGYGEQAAFYTQKLADLDDERRVDATRIALLEKQLKDKDRELLQASFELQEATAQITRTREDLERWKGEMERLRGKLRTMEKDSKVTLETIIQTLEQFLDRGPDARRPLDIEELLAPPKKAGK